MSNHELSHILKTITCTDHNGSISRTYYNSDFCLITSSFYKLVFLDTLGLTQRIVEHGFWKPKKLKKGKSGRTSPWGLLFEVILVISWNGSVSPEDGQSTASKCHEDHTHS